MSIYIFVQLKLTVSLTQQTSEVKKQEQPDCKPINDCKQKKIDHLKFYIPLLYSKNKSESII